MYLFSFPTPLPRLLHSRAEEAGGPEDHRRDDQRHELGSAAAQAKGRRPGPDQRQPGLAGARQVRVHRQAQR